jgi:hypothetical protein
VIDATGSMSRLYSNGTVQETVERIVPVSLRLDDDGTMPTWFYASGCARTEDITANNYEGYVPRTLPGPMKPVQGVQKHSCASISRKGEVTVGGVNNEIVILNALLADEPADRTTPLLVIFMTDGGFAPSKDIARIITNAAHKPIFWQFVGIGNSNFGMLRNLDTLPNRVVDNAGFFAVNDLAKISDEELYDRLLSEFPAWLKAARAKGILGTLSASLSSLSGHPMRIWFNRGFSLAPIAKAMMAADTELEVFTSVAKSRPVYTEGHDTWVEPTLDDEAYVAWVRNQIIENGIDLFIPTRHRKLLADIALPCAVHLPADIATLELRRQVRLCRCDCRRAVPP